jgi:hypothetical protein
MDMDTAATRTLTGVRPTSGRQDRVALDARAASRRARLDRAARAAAAVGGVTSLAVVLLGPAQPAASAAVGSTVVFAVDAVQPAVMVAQQRGGTTTTGASE